MISLSHGLRRFHTHFWQVDSFEFQYKCITEKCILPFYKRPGQIHNFICCLKYICRASSFYKAPSTRMRIFLKTEVFFSVLALRPHVNGVFGMRKRRFSKTLSRVEVFENTVFVFTCRRVKTEVFENAVFVFTCGRVKTEVFENDDVIIGSSL